MSCRGVRARQDVLQLMEEEGKQVDGGLWGRSKPHGNERPLGPELVCWSPHGQWWVG